MKHANRTLRIQMQVRRSQKALAGNRGKGAKRVNAREIREYMQNGGVGPERIEWSKSRNVQKAIIDLAHHLADIALKNGSRTTGGTGDTSPAKKEFVSRIAFGVGIPRDADGNVIYFDEGERPYIIVDSEKVYVIVYKGPPTSEDNVLGQCNAENPSGDVLFTDPIPEMSAAP